MSEIRQNRERTTIKFGTWLSLMGASYGFFYIGAHYEELIRFSWVQDPDTYDTFLNVTIFVVCSFTRWLREFIVWGQTSAFVSELIWFSSERMTLWKGRDGWSVKSHASLGSGYDIVERGKDGGLSWHASYILNKVLHSKKNGQRPIPN